MSILELQEETSKQRIERLKRMQNKDWLVIKSNNLINAKGRYSYSRNELKLIANLVANICPNEKGFERKRVALRDLGFIDDNTKNHNNYDKYFQELMSKPFQIPGSKQWYNWFIDIGYENGYINYAFHENLKPFLLNLKENFTKYHLENIMNLKSSYSIHIYELLAQFRDKGGRSILLEDFREILNLSNKYTNSHIIEILDRAKIDLKKNTNIIFTFTMKKEGRKYNRIDFKILSQKIPNLNLFNVDEYEDKYETYKEVEIEELKEEAKEIIEDETKSNVSMFNFNKNQTSISDYLIEVDEKLDNE